jgi:integrase
MTALATIAPSPPLDLDSLLSTALVHLSPNTRRVYVSRFRHYYNWWRDNSVGDIGLALFQRLTIQHYLQTAQSTDVIIGFLAAVKAVAEQAEANGTITFDTLVSIRTLKPPQKKGWATGRWLTKEQSALLLQTAALHRNGTIAARDLALVALMLGCGLRRAEICQLTWNQFEEVEDGWVIRNLNGKGNRQRTIKVPQWVWSYIVQWGNVILEQEERVK